MTLIESLPRNEFGQIEIPIGAKVEENVYPGLVNLDWLSAAFVFDSCIRDLWFREICIGKKLNRYVYALPFGVGLFYL